MTTEEIFARVFKILLSTEWPPEDAWKTICEEQRKEFDKEIRELAAEIVFTRTPEDS